ncbi:relaxase domain-containing protein [Cryobacterium aureum]|uniref:relaxase domain-containing protein n=1 Tax=Cryobacterium aureum TaxID=995037 RepID=UPI00101AD1A0
MNSVRPGAVAGFDFTFSIPKSASVLWHRPTWPRTHARIAARRGGAGGCDRPDRDGVRPFRGSRR